MLFMSIEDERQRAEYERRDPMTLQLPDLVEVFSSEETWRDVIAAVKEREKLLEVNRGLSIALKAIDAERDRWIEQGVGGFDNTGQRPGIMRSLNRNNEQITALVTKSNLVDHGDTWVNKLVLANPEAFTLGEPSSPSKVPHPNLVATIGESSLGLTACEPQFFGDHPVSKYKKSFPWQLSYGRPPGTWTTHLTAFYNGSYPLRGKLYDLLAKNTKGTDGLNTYTTLETFKPAFYAQIFYDLAGPRKVSK